MANYLTDPDQILCSNSKKVNVMIPNVQPDKFLVKEKISQVVHVVMPNLYVSDA